MNEYSLIHDSSELRKLIAENPDLPITVLVEEEAACRDFLWTYCSSVSCSLGWVLDVKTPYDDDEGHVFTDKDEFENAIVERLCDDIEYRSMTNEEFDYSVKKERDKYECHWKRVIAIRASN